jgi:DNA-binding NarL/FixJ family response regulator
MTQATSQRVVVLCRSPERQVLVERLVSAARPGAEGPATETHTSAVEACLAIARRPARAAIVNLEDIQGAERDVVSALGRTQPGLRIYTLVRPEEEPLARRLVRQGATDYFVLPSDVARLPEALGAGA